jgi:outer membrane receptor protein involved in Fe transport
VAPEAPHDRGARQAVGPRRRAQARMDGVGGIVTAAALAWASGAQAQTPTAVTTLPRAEVVGTTPVAGLGLPKAQIAANVQTATSADIDRSHALDLSDFMSRRLGGVHVNEVQNNPFQPDLNFRGFTASSLLGTPQGLSIYVDGVRMNQPFGDVVSWDLIPRGAIASVTLMPGSNPLFGLNTLGGALSVGTKNGRVHAGSSVQLSAGSHRRVALEFESGGSRSDGIDWYVHGNRFHERGWRQASPTDVSQLFAKLGHQTADTRLALSAAFADNTLIGNGMQDQRLLAADRASIYTSPDRTVNRSAMLNLETRHSLTPALAFSGNAYYRRIRTGTLNGDVNDDALDQSLYQPNAAEQAALAGAGYSGFPTSGASADDTPFPRWRCIANALLADEPAQKCNGVLNTTRTRQSNHGLSAQLDWDGVLAGFGHRAVVGAALDISRVAFTQGSQLGYLNPDHSVTGVAAFGDGVSGGSIDGEPYDTRVDLSARTRTWSVFATDTLALNERTHLTLSGRYNRTTVTNRDAIIPGDAPGSLDGDHVFSRFNPAIGLTWAPSKMVGGYLGVNVGSRAPSAIELGCADPANPCKLPNSFAGDPPLKQVVTRTVEAGVRGGVANRFSWTLGLFRADNRDDILFVADNQAGFGYFRNFGQTRRQGLEAGLAWRADAGLTLGIHYTYLDATYRSTETVDGSANSSNDAATGGLPGVEGTITIQPGHRIPLIPRHLLKLYADYQASPALTLGADLSAVGSSFARGNENNRHRPDGAHYLGTGRNPGYAVLNLSADYRPSPKWNLFVQVNNVFDRRYTTAAQLGATAFDAAGNFRARPFPADANGDWPLQNSTFYAPGAPRTFRVGVKYAIDG